VSSKFGIGRNKGKTVRYKLTIAKRESQNCEILKKERKKSQLSDIKKERKKSEL